MKAPTDKSNDTIQIMVTRACNLFNCSNCTQLLPFRKDTLHMSLDVFRQAIRSLNDWPGIIGIFGGNPCSHPKFPELMEILVEEIPDQRHRGLWSNNLLGHGPLVREVFYPHGRFNLNAHAVSQAGKEIEKYLPGKLIKMSDHQLSWHSAILVAWQDMGLSEKEWVAMREDCDINQKWSAAVAERDGKAYAYFCEVAASIDGIRNTNNGLEVRPGWWKDKMNVYANQVKTCCDAGCGVPLRTRGHLDRHDTYDVSDKWMDHVEGHKGAIDFELHEVIPVRTKEATDYMQQRTKR
jgi:hypothetical protein